MRPLRKWVVGDHYDNGKEVQARYNSHRDAFLPLYLNLGPYCCFCEAFCTDLEVEHVISQDQDGNLAHDWGNFLLSCGRCNGRDNKSNKPVYLDKIYMPHLHNTLLALKYLEGGIIEANNSLLPQQIAKSQELINLVGLDKYPGNPIYPRGFPVGDRRWEYRRKAWEMAKIKLADYEKGGINDPEDIADFAKERGFFSIWYTVFNDHILVKNALIKAFTGTAEACFDASFTPIPRNPNDLGDNI